MDEPTDYSNSGFDKFLSRGDTPNLGGSLDQNVPNNSMPADRTQVTGQLGDTLSIGKLGLDGPSSAITVRDDSNLRVVIGQQSDGSQAVIIGKQGVDANIARPKDLLFNSVLNLFQVALAGTYTFPSQAIPPSATQFQQFSVPIPDGIIGVPGYLAYSQFFPVPGLQLYTGFPSSYFTQIFNNMTFGDYVDGNMGHTIVIGIDDKKLYVNQSTINGNGASTVTSTPVTIKYFIYQQSITT